MTSRDDLVERSGSVTRSVERLAAEHEARGLLNMIELAGRVLEAGADSEQEAAYWDRETEAARTRLEQLYARGLPRDFVNAKRFAPAPPH